jgi:excisionase family DNA binding protein
MNELTPVAYSVPRAAQLTGLSRSQLYELMKRRELAYVKVGRRRLIAHDDLQALISRHRVAHEMAAPPRNTPASDGPTILPRHRRSRPPKVPVKEATA